MNTETQRFCNEDHEVCGAFSPNHLKLLLFDAIPYLVVDRQSEGEDFETEVANVEFTVIDTSGLINGC